MELSRVCPPTTDCSTHGRRRSFLSVGTVTRHTLQTHLSQGYADIIKRKRGFVLIRAALAQYHALFLQLLKEKLMDLCTLWVWKPVLNSFSARGCHSWQLTPPTLLNAAGYTLLVCASCTMWPVMLMQLWVPVRPPCLCILSFPLSELTRCVPSLKLAPCFFHKTVYPTEAKTVSFAFNALSSSVFSMDWSKALG